MQFRFRNKYFLCSSDSTYSARIVSFNLKFPPIFQKNLNYETANYVFFSLIVLFYLPVTDNLQYQQYVFFCQNASQGSLPYKDLTTGNIIFMFYN